jgi:hypothetical protein
MNSSLRPNRVPESELCAASESSNLEVACKREHHFFSFVGITICSIGDSLMTRKYI